MLLQNLIEEGGVIMIPLMVCSLAIWAVIFERFWGLAKFKREFKHLHRVAKDLLEENRLEEVRGLYLKADRLIAAPHLALLDDDNQVDTDIKIGRVQRRLVETQAGLKRFLWVLGTVSSSAPFIGLFGTVVGIIKSFDSMAATGQGGFAIVAKGLSEALIATAAGILVAVIAVMFYNYFQVKVNAINLEFRNKLEDLADLIGNSSH